MLKASSILEKIPRVALFSPPTPLERMSRLEKEYSSPGLFVKRDDCMTLGMGGNKLRSLEFWMGEAVENKHDIIVAAGAPVSNQCRLAAAAAVKLGLDCLILHSSDRPDTVEGNLLMSCLMGVEIRFIGAVDERTRGEIAKAAAEELKARGRSPYLIGDAAIGALGYVSGAFELYGQQLMPDCKIQHVFLPGSMGTTEAGFILGNALLGYPFEIHLVSVEYGEEELRARIAAILERTSAYLNVSLDRPWSHGVHIYDEYLGGGYDVPTEESLAAISAAASKEGIFLENTYTGKTFGGMLDKMRKKEIPETERVCFIHTGGTPALFAQQAPLRPLIDGALSGGRGRRASR